MQDQVFTYLIGGAAGEGVKKAGSIGAHILKDLGRYIFQMDDYQSLIKGGHNFSVISSSTRPILSHYLNANLVVALDKKSYELHKEHLTKDGIIIYNSDRIQVENELGLGLPLTTEAKNYPNPDLRLGVAGVVLLAAVIGFDKTRMGEIIKNQYPSDLENNLAYAEAVYSLAQADLGDNFGRYNLDAGEIKRKILTGNEAISLGAAAGGLDIYIAYPMTPASSILHYLAVHDQDLGLTVMHPENEIAVANIAIGAAFAGARAMVGSSGGGFALMQEAFSLAGMTETPLLCILSSRPGPSTGVPTYTEQADLRFALNQGHGDFPRIVGSPGTIEEAFYLTAEMLELVWKFQTPGILLTEKHLAETSMTVELEPENTTWAEPLMFKQKNNTHGYKRYLDTIDGVSPLLFPPSREQIYWSSYEHDELGVTTEDPELIARMHDKRNRKTESIIEYFKNSGKIKPVNIFNWVNGDLKVSQKHKIEKDIKSVIFTYGSTTMSVLESLQQLKDELEAIIVQLKYLEPFPVWELEKYSYEPVIVVEQSTTGQFAHLLREKSGLGIKYLINQYDGRPFEPKHLASMLREVS